MHNVPDDVEVGTLAVLDVETTMLKAGEIPRTLFWGLFVEGEHYRRFETSAELWRYLESRKDKLLLYIHHDFDAVQALVDGCPLTVRDVRGGRILRAIGPGHHEWRNSHALFPASLASLLAETGRSKAGLDDLDARNVNDTVDALAAFRDLSSAYERTWGVYPLARNYLTASGVAFASAQNHAGKLPQDLSRREAYRGGRVEALRVGYCGEADCFDINSSYPAAFLDVPERDQLLHVRVAVDTDGPSPLWLYGDDDGKLLFPAGRFETWVWASNYERYIRPHGRVREMKLLEAPYHVDFRWIKDVAGLVSDVYQVRADAKKRGDNAQAYACKLGLNSIYGRLGLKDEREIAVTKDTVAGDDDVTFYPLPDGRFLSFVKVPAKPAANYPFAGAITDNARARLYDAMERAGGEVFYCDTDSVFLQAGADFPVSQGGALGLWKPEGRAHLSVTSAKDYAFGPKGAAELDKRDGKYLWVDAAGTVIREKLPHEKWALKGGKSHYEWTLKRALGGKKVAVVEKHRQTAYDKREVMPNGSTLPWRRVDW